MGVVAVGSARPTKVPDEPGPTLNPSLLNLPLAPCCEKAFILVVAVSPLTNLCADWGKLPLKEYCSAATNSINITSSPSAIVSLLTTHSK